MAKAFRRNMCLVRVLEKEYYGDNSFYHLRETGQYQEPTCAEGDDLMEGLEGDDSKEGSEGLSEAEIDLEG